MLRCRLLSLLLAAALPAAAQDAARSQPTVRICADEVPLFPWRLSTDPKVPLQGLDFTLLEIAGQRAGVRVEFIPQPWKRCLADLQRGQHDAALGVSFRPDRLEIGVFPLRTRDQQPDDGLRMRRESYSLYKLAPQPLVWDGKTLAPTPGSDFIVGAPSGYSIVEQLRGMNLKVDEGTRSIDSNLDKLIRGRVHAVALPTGEGDDALKREPRWGQVVQKVEPPLVEKSYFLLYSRAFFAAHEPVARRLWDELAPARESAAFKRAETEALKR